MCLYVSLCVCDFPRITTGYAEAQSGPERMQHKHFDIHILQLPDPKSDGGGVLASSGSKTWKGIEMGEQIRKASEE